MLKFKIFIIVVISACLIMSMGSIAWSGDKSDSEYYAQMKIMKKPEYKAVKFLCPSGWHKKTSTSEEFKCAPDKPSQMNCPEGWKYVEALDCQSYAGLGSQTTCSGCEVGCIKIMVPR